MTERLSLNTNSRHIIQTKIPLNDTVASRSFEIRLFRKAFLFEKKSRSRYIVYTNNDKIFQLIRICRPKRVG